MPAIRRSLESLKKTHLHFSKALRYSNYLLRSRPEMKYYKTHGVHRHSNSFHRSFQFTISLVVRGRRFRITFFHTARPYLYLYSMYKDTSRMSIYLLLIPLLLVESLSHELKIDMSVTFVNVEWL